MAEPRWATKNSLTNALRQAEQAEPGQAVTMPAAHAAKIIRELLLLRSVALAAVKQADHVEEQGCSGDAGYAFDEAVQELQAAGWPQVSRARSE